MSWRLFAVVTVLVALALTAYEWLAGGRNASFEMPAEAVRSVDAPARSPVPPPPGGGNESGPGGVERAPAPRE